MNIDLQFPIGGLNENVAFSAQPPNTTRDTLNMRPIDPITGRIRGAQRAGLLELGGDTSQLCTNQLTDPETFNTANDWVIANGTISATTSANPFGETSPNPAVLMRSTAVSGTCQLTQNPDQSGLFLAQQVFTMYVKRPPTGTAADDFLCGVWNASSIVAVTRFDVSAGGVVTVSQDDPLSSGTTVTSAVETISNGWYRVTVGVAAPVPIQGLPRGAFIETNRGTSVAEDLWIWGAHICDNQLTAAPYRSGVIGTGEKVQEILPMTVDNRQLTWAIVNPGTSVTTTNGQFGAAYSGLAAGGDMRYERVTQRVYQQLGFNRIGEYDRSGNLLDTVTVPNPPDVGGTVTTQITQFDVDGAGNIFVNVGLQPGSIDGSGGTIAGGSPPLASDGFAVSRTYRMARDIAGNWIIIWTVYHSESWITAVKFHDGRMYLGRYTPHASSSNQGVPGWSVYADVLTNDPGSVPQVGTPSTGISGATTDVRIHGLDVNANGIIIATGATLDLTSSEVFVLDAQTGGAPLDTVADDLGVGLGCKFDTDSAFYTIGHDEAPGSGTNIRRFTIDTSGTMTSVWDASPSDSATAGDAYQARIDTDKFNNVWVPLRPSGGTGLEIQGFDSSGTQVARFTETASGVAGGFAVQVDSDIPDYRDTTTLWPEFVYGSAYRIFKVRFASSTLAAGSPRTNRSVVVAGGNIKTYQVVSWTTTPPTVVIGSPNDSSAGAMETKDFVQGVTLFNKAFFADGDTYRVYDPKDISTSSEGEITNFEATAGVIPPRCKLLSAWNGRLVLARGDNEQEWFLSAQGDPFNWDFFPAVASQTQAVQGALARAGLAPDIANGIIPYTDDLMIMGGDHSIWRFTGDPAAGGQIDLISDITGMSFGKAWTKDPEGAIYFFGSRGGVYRMTPQSMPERISLGSIERELQGIDLAANFVRLAWNYRDEGLHVLQMPYGNVTAQLDHWFWEQKTSSWWKDNFYDTSLISNQPTAVAVSDGDDPDDRKLLIGGGGNTSLSSGDGCIAAWDEAADNDAGTAIHSRVLLGPFASMGSEVRLSALWPVLASDQDGCDYRLYVTDSADELGEVVDNGRFEPGQNGRISTQGRGSFIFLELSNASTKRWAYEKVVAEVYRAGRPSRRV